MRDDGFTVRQREIFDYLVKFTEDNGYQPSYREIGQHFGIKSTRAVSDLIEALQRKGYLEKDHSRARSVSFTQRGIMSKNSTIKKALADFGEGIRRLFLKESYATLGSMSAADDDDKTSFAFDENLVQGKNTFLLRTKGDSMINAHIQDGDLILVDPDQKEYNKGVITDGDIVVARVGDDATVKHIYRENDRLFRLQPANETMKPIYVHPEDGDFQIVGKVVGVYRQIP